MLYRLLQAFFTYCPSSAAVARTYAGNLHRPLANLLTPLRLARYAYLLTLAVRLCLNSLLRQTYHQYDLTLYLFESTITHHMAGLAFLPTLAMVFTLDVTFVLQPHPKVAPMLVDLLQVEVASVTAAVTQLAGHFHQLLVTFQGGGGGGSSSSSSSTSSRFSRKVSQRWPKGVPSLQLAYFRSFTLMTQRRLALASNFFEELNVATLPLEATFLLLASSRYVLVSAVKLYQQGRPPLQIANLLLDAISFLIVAQYNLQKSFLFMEVLFLVVLVWWTQAREVMLAAVRATSVAQFVSGRSGGKGRTQQQPNVVQSKASTTTNAISGLGSNSRFSALLSTIWAADFMQDHVKLLTDLVLFNQHFTSKLIFWFYLPLIIGSIYILCMIYFFSVHILLKVYLLLVYLFFLIVFGLLALLPMVPHTLYSADGHIYSAQMRCTVAGGKPGSSSNHGTSLLRTKLKLMSYYEVLRTEEKATFTFGSQAKVERQWLLELALLYTSFIMYSFKIFIKQSM